MKPPSPIEPPPVGVLPCDEPTWRRVAEELSLAPQQERIVELILRGLQDHEIAKRLGLSVPTIRTYLRRAYDRLGVSDRLSLMRYLFSLATRGDNAT